MHENYMKNEKKVLRNEITQERFQQIRNQPLHCQFMRNIDSNIYWVMMQKLGTKTSDKWYVKKPEAVSE